MGRVAVLTQQKQKSEPVSLQACLGLAHFPPCITVLKSHCCYSAAVRSFSTDTPPFPSLPYPSLPCPSLPIARPRSASIFPRAGCCVSLKHSPSNSRCLLATLQPGARGTRVPTATPPPTGATSRGTLASMPPTPPLSVRYDHQLKPNIKSLVSLCKSILGWDGLDKHFTTV